MGTLSIVEYDRLPFDANGARLPINAARKAASKTCTSGTSSAQADAPNSDTRFIRVAVLDDTYVEVDATATTNSLLMPAGSVDWFECGRLNFRTRV